MWLLHLDWTLEELQCWYISCVWNQISHFLVSSQGFSFHNRSSCKKRKKRVIEKTALELFIDDAFAYGDPMEVPPCGEPRSPAWFVCFQPQSLKLWRIIKKDACFTSQVHKHKASINQIYSVYWAKTLQFVTHDGANAHHLRFQRLPKFVFRVLVSAFW